MSETLQFELVTPERLAVSAAVNMVEVPGEMGDFGVLPGHAPFLSMIRPGVISVHTADGLARYFVPAGYAEVNPDGCIVLAEHVHNLAETDRATVLQELEEAKAALARANDDISRTLAEKQVMLKEALVEALSA